MMPLVLVLLGGGLLGASGVPGLALSWRSLWGQRVATVLTLAGSAVGLTGAARALLSAGTIEVVLPWSLPGAAWELSLDALGAFFLIPVFLMAALGSLYGSEYWSQRRHPGNARRLRFFWGTVMFGMVVLLLARNALLFLLGWEFMALSGFFLVGTEDHEPEVRRASWIYFISTHVATLTLFGMFALLRHVTGSFHLRALAIHETGLGTLYGLFFMALLGFGVKAGLMPLHVWLPDAHANAPSHVSALLSGIMLKMGIYGMIRIFGFLPAPPISWGALLLFLGTISGILGIAFAVGQRDLKRLLAYSSVENIGIIVLGLGLAMVGRSVGRGDWVLLGLAGGLLHVWNHSLFKPLLFMGAGSVIHSLGTREIDRMGGLARSMPRTALLFLVGALAISGLPPLNGFVSEVLIYLGLFRTLPAQGAGAPSWTAGALAVPALALIGALALTCFVKVSGAVFLGAPRAPRAHPAHDPSGRMLAPMALLAISSIAIGLGSPWLAPVLDRVVACWVPSEAPHPASLLSLVPLGWLTGTGAALGVVALAGFLACEAWLRPGSAPKTGTWDCGYARPSARMQYTSSSFSQMVVRLFRGFLRPRVESPVLGGIFPEPQRFRSVIEDVVLSRFILPVLQTLKRAAVRTRVLQRGLMRTYVLYIFATVVLLLLWSLPVGQLFVRLLTR
ncbi:MAG TPA: proton-conducting transporter membrane subunit [Planctomycetota bacterium]|nr:proton-conducting transporter membrane subunit [Planctomycetota bacterium]